MQKLTEQLVTLATTPLWKPVTTEDVALSTHIQLTEQALLKAKIICYITTPEPDTTEEPDEDNTPQPEHPEEPLVSTSKTAA